MIPSRRTLLAAMGASLPFGLAARVGASENRDIPPLTLQFRSFEEAVQKAFGGRPRGPFFDVAGYDEIYYTRRIEVGHSDLIQAGVQGCHNDRAFAGYPAGYLRILRAGFEPGPIRRGVRLYVATVDVYLAGGPVHGLPSRPIDFGAIPPAPILS